MEYKVYQVVVSREVEAVDMDCCPIWEDEPIVDDIFASKKEAIRIAQSRFDRQQLNKYVRSVWAAVYSRTITDKGMQNGTRIYNKYKMI